MSSYSEILQRLYFINGSNGVKFGLENMFRLCELFSHPEKSFPVVHVAGTNGKGSVSLKIARGYESFGKTTGLFTSPHLSTFRERIRINGSMIKESEAATLIEKVLDTAEQNQIPATFFEITTLAAFLYFAEKKVDVAVLETGLGGRLDATNVVIPILSIITSISLDHTEILGKTREEIAFEKAGIIKQGVPVVVGPNVPLQTIKEQAEKKKSSLIQVLGAFDWFDQENSAIAGKALEQLGVPEINIRAGIEARPPCRLEIVQDSPPVILDVAHNPDGLRHLFQAIHAKFPGKKIRVVCGLSKNKDLADCLKIIGKNANAIHLIEASNPRAAKTADLANLLTALGFGRQPLYLSISQTLSEAMAAAENNHEVLAVCGSFFIMNEARQSLGLCDEEDPRPLFENFLQPSRI